MYCVYDEINKAMRDRRGKRYDEASIHKTKKELESIPAREAK